MFKSIFGSRGWVVDRFKYLKVYVGIMYKHNCLNCGIEFVSPRPKRLYCSSNCYGKHHYVSHPRPKITPITSRESCFMGRHRLRNLALKIYGGKCMMCGEERREFLCFDHVNNDAHWAENTHKKIEKILARIRSEGWGGNEIQILCHSCNMKKQICKNKSSDKRHKRRRVSILMKYGGKCECCGESDLDKLCIDHINGGGKEACKLLSPIGNEGSGRLKLYKILNDSPRLDNEYRVLCANCNMSQHIYGSCPHVFEKTYEKCLQS
jgi:hypothetical protein